MSYSTLVEMFKKAVENYPDKPAFGTKKDGEYQYFTYAEMAEKIASLGQFLKNFGITKGSNVAILSANRFEWAISDYAIMSLGAATVPVYPTLPANQVEYIVKDCGASIVIVSDTLQLEKILEIRKNLPALEYILMMDNANIDNDDMIKDFQTLLEGQKLPQKNYFEEAVSSITPEDLATIIYTSGTTGIPKGVMLTHKNFVSNIMGTLNNVAMHDTDLFLSVLPLSHVFERMAGHFLPVGVGASIAYAEDFTTLIDNLKEVKPTILICVPRFYEKVYAKVLDGVLASSSAKQKIFNWAMEIGKNIAAVRESNKPITGKLKWQNDLATKLVFHKFHAVMGGRLRFFVSGGAPLSKEVAAFYVGSGFTLVEGYGLTETSPVIAVNKLENFKIGSVGLTVFNVECKIADDGEILVRGPQVTQGYFNNQEETRAAFDEDGWFYTGDIGKLDEDGFLFITDRKKNLLVTAGGKNVAPQPIEMRLTKSPYISHALLIGDRRKYISALIVPDREILSMFADTHNIKYDSLDEVAASPEMAKVIEEQIISRTEDLANYESIKKHVIISDELTVDNGYLTPKMELKRKKVMEKYTGKIDQMYSG